MSTNLRFGFAVANVKDIRKARSFYTEVLGLKVQREAPNYIQFENFAIASDNADATDPLELYWTVDDADAAHRELTSRGAVCSPVASQPFGKVFTTKDPDGRERFIVALAATRPSKAV